MANIVERVVVKGLYDLYDYDITFHEGGITLITGPNGYGKTSILSIIKNALNLDYKFFYDLIFKKITIHFHDEKNDTKLVINKVLKKQISDVFDDLNKYEVKLTFTSKGENDINDNFTPEISEIYRRKRLLNTSPDEDYYMRTLMRLHREFEAINHMIKQDFGTYAEFTKNKNVCFVKAQRIISDKKDDKDNPTYTIEEIAQDLKSRYADMTNEYTKKSQEIDSTFVKRLLNQKQSGINKEQFNSLMRQFKGIIDGYNKVGLLTNFKMEGNYNDKFKFALFLYMKDMLEKISVYEDFYEKLALFRNFMNEAGLSNKYMHLNGEQGISFESKSGRGIPLNRLSSGEQNLVILFYKLIFETKPNTLLIIDEPESSLHVEWLEKMLDNYLEIEKITGCQMIIATHSVPFVNGHWNIAYDLSGGSYQD